MCSALLAVIRYLACTAAVTLSLHDHFACTPHCAHTLAVTNLNCHYLTLQMPFGLLETVVYTCIVYFIVGYERGAGYFFIFYLICFSMMQVMSAIMRFNACASPNLVISNSCGTSSCHDTACLTLHRHTLCCGEPCCAVLCCAVPCCAMLNVGCDTQHLLSIMACLLPWVLP